MQPSLKCSWFTVALLSACGSPAPSLVTDRGSELDYEPTCSEADAGDEVEACLFGEQFADIRTSPALQLTGEIWIDSVDGLSELEGEQVLLAVQQSSHTDVTTPGEALERVDQQEIRRIDFYEIASGREFVVFEYGVGDNSYGAFFERESVEVVGSIHDGDVLGCIR
ncbi:MAG TPA: hypothetical protein VFG30_41395 [Polyangiales bacterium]|nr:hypothetical protein [Polyangiales bacterium]